MFEMKGVVWSLQPELHKALVDILNEIRDNDSHRATGAK